MDQQGTPSGQCAKGTDRTLQLSHPLLPTALRMSSVSGTSFLSRNLLMIQAILQRSFILSHSGSLNDGNVGTATGRVCLRPHLRVRLHAPFHSDTPSQAK